MDVAERRSEHLRNIQGADTVQPASSVLLSRPNPTLKTTNSDIKLQTKALGPVPPLTMTQLPSPGLLDINTSTGAAC